MSNLFCVDGFALERKGGVAGNYDAVRNALQIGGNVFGNSVGEIVLSRIT